MTRPILTLLFAAAACAGEVSQEEQDRLWAEAMKKSAAIPSDTRKDEVGSAGSNLPSVERISVEQQQQEAAERARDRQARRDQAAAVAEANRATANATSRMEKASATLQQLRLRSQQLNTWVQANGPQLQQAAIHLESVRAQHTAAVNKWNAEVAQMGARRVVRTAMNPGGTTVGGPTVATERLVNQLAQQLQMAQQTWQEGNALHQKTVAELADIARVLPSWEQEHRTAAAELAARTNAPAPVPPEQQAQAGPTVLPIDVLREAARLGELQLIQIISADGALLGNLDPTGISRESIFNEYGDYGSKFGANSVRNQFGVNGSEFGANTHANKFAQNPPVLTYKGQAFCYLSANSILTPRLTLDQLGIVKALAQP